MHWRWPALTAAAAGVQMVLGAAVVGKDAGFVCPDWPLCNGQWLPAFSGLLALEWVHRLSALVVCLMVGGLSWAIWRHHRQQRRVLSCACAAVCSLLVQVVVGGLIVLLRAPGVATTVDVANSMFLLAVLVVLAVELYEQGQARGLSDAALAEMVSPAGWWLAAVAAAVVVGAVFRHTGSSEALFGVNHYLASHGQLRMPSPRTAHAWLYLHVASSVGVAVGACVYWVQALRRQRQLATAGAGLALVALQAVLGVLSLWTSLNFVVVTLHWTVASALVALSVYAWWSSRWAAERLRQQARATALTAVEPQSIP
ncbi:MAG: COX15/CtaA family protein [Alicyclobacillus sp.]|nr:COX15/CtaA family protein [Alicyclobacillus sp.]